MEIEIFRSDVTDNFFYALGTKNGETLLIDPVDGRKAKTYIKSSDERELTGVVNTHFHPDHIDGNQTLFDEWPEIPLYLSEGDRDRILEKQPENEKRAESLTGGDQIPVGELKVQIFDTPGHTPGHISLLCQDALFSGDTIFVGGAGNCSFGGDPGQLFRTFRDVLRELDGDITFYPGHDYAEKNCEFIRSIESVNASAEGLFEKSRKTEEDEILLTTLETESNYNPFMRYDDPHLKELLQETHPDVFDEKRRLSDDSDETVFRTLRALRDEW